MSGHDKAKILVGDWLSELPGTIDVRLRLAKGNKDGTPSPSTVEDFDLPPPSDRDNLTTRVLEAARKHAEDRALDNVTHSRYSYCLCKGKGKKAPHVRFQIEVNGPVIVPDTDAGITRESYKMLYTGFKETITESRRREKNTEDHFDRILGWYRRAWMDERRAREKSDRRLTFNQRALNDFARLLANSQDRSDTRRANIANETKLVDLEVEAAKAQLKGNWLEDLVEDVLKEKLKGVATNMGTPFALAVAERAAQKKEKT